MDDAANDASPNAGDAEQAQERARVPALRLEFAGQLAQARRPDGSLDEETLSATVIARYGQAPAAGLPEADLLRAVLENVVQGICCFDRNQRLIVGNQRYAEIYGLRPGLVVPGTTLREIVDQRYLVGSTPAMSADTFLEWRDRVIQTNKADDSITELQNGRVIAIRHQPMADGGWIATHEDITERRQTERRLDYLSRYHLVTGLPNRIAFTEQLQEVLRRTSEQSPCAVLSLALDGLLAINDSLGRPVGTQLLRTQAQRLREHLRPADLLCQQGDNEFVIVQCGGPQPAEAIRLATVLLDRISQPALLDGQPLVVGASIGIALALGTGLDADALVTNADIALHQAQTEAPGVCRLFDPEMDQQLRARRQLELDLREAVERLAFTMHYQPQIDVKTRRVVGFEALIRWNHPQHGAVAPGVFIPMAEQLGLIERIGAWVLQTACAEAVTWPEGVRVAVNVSALQFVGDELLGLVADTLRRTGLAPPRLELEITETCVVANATAAATTLAALRSSGVRIAMDDFGTGYSSLSYLPILPFDTIKIDRSFVANLGAGAAHTAIIRSIISLCVSLGMTCTAEGVETEEQFAILAREHCTEVQGLLFAAAAPAETVATLLDTVDPRDSSLAKRDHQTNTGLRANPDGRAGLAAVPVVAAPTLDTERLAISFPQIIQSAHDIVMVTTADFNGPGPAILYVNPAFTRLTGYTPSEVLGHSPRMLQGPDTSRASLNKISARLRAGREVQETVLNYAKGGAQYWLDMRIVPVPDDTGRIVQFAAIERDVTGERRRLDELQHAADRDALTGLFNRRALLRIMDGELRSARLHSAAGLCVAYVDIDHFKQINDTFGHATGDAVLLGLGDRLVENVRRLDTVGRIGGEEFAVCMPAIALREATAIAERLRWAVVAQPFDTPSGRLTVSISLGVARAAGQEASLTEALQRADQAMYAAKRAGRDRVETDPPTSVPTQ